VNEPLIVLFKEKFFHRKSIGGEAFFGNSATGHFSGKGFFERHSSGHSGSNDTVSSLYNVWGLRKWAVTHTHFEYYI
jgi:hypothetical protein